MANCSTLEELQYEKHVDRNGGDCVKRISRCCRPKARLYSISIFLSCNLSSRSTLSCSRIFSSAFLPTNSKLLSNLNSSIPYISTDGRHVTASLYADTTAKIISFYFMTYFCLLCLNTVSGMRQRPITHSTEA